MFLRQVRADQQQQTSDFRLRKPKRTRVKSSNISSHVLSSDTTSPFTNININSQIHKKNKTPLQPEDTLHEENRTPLQPEDTLHEENRTPLQPEDTPINENDDLYSIFDNNGNFFNDPNDSDDFYNNSGDDQETNREFNEKAYDGNKKQNHYSRNEAGPYFPNYTMLLLFLWITKHQIGLEAYRDFANIIKHPKFNPKDVPISLATIKKYRDGLPLLPFKGHTVSLNNRNTPSTSKSTGQALIFPLKDILHRILANPQLREYMYFGSGIYCENKCEIWHGKLWHKSPLFGEISIRLNNDIYIDKFGPFRNAYHAIGGIYLQIGNMKQILRQKLKNHFLYGFIPYAAASDEVLQPIIKDIQEFEREYELEINNQHTTLQFAEVRNVQTQTERDFLTMEYGIRENPSVFDNVMRDWHLQCPHDAFHCMGGIAKEMLQATFEILTAMGEEVFLKTWRNFEFPSTWSRQQNPITHLDLYFFSDYLHLSMIMPFFINRVITNVTLLNKPFTEHLIKVYNITKNQVIDRLLNLWISFSKMVYLVFRKEFSENCYNNLQQSLMQWAIQVAKIFPNITRLPNFHIQCHFIMHAKHFATLVNTAVSTKEMMHRLYKGIVPHSNKKDIELDFVRRDNCL
ncbi:hypothetical protein RhiirA4_429309 [Rhizophagus irregularis]|uniref:Transposase domain-containing protein n=1 Tax=Rhizophagus irregularis TaxID=588596 RepID=A0A2I1HG65_9GLOM|nr:hypothetical protein RhiirA4_429309 [Rhizophagus irregularis]